METKKISIPEGWRKVPIGECIVEKKKSPINVEDANEYGIYPFFTSGESVLRYDEKLADGENLYIADGGTADVKYFNGASAYSNHTYVLGCRDGYCTKFLYYVLLYLTDYIDKNYFQGTGLKNLQKKDFKHHEIIIPESKDEQQRIADALSKLDDSLSKTQSLIDKYELIKRGLMQDLLTFGIDSEGNVRSEKTHKFKDSPLGRIPEEWECVEMSILMDAIDAQPDHRTPAEVEDGTPYVGISDVDDYGSLIIDKCRRVGLAVVEKQKSIFSVEEGDIIFGKIGTIGKPKMLPVLNEVYAISANVIVIKPKENALYLYYALKSEYVDKEVDLSIHSTSQPAFGMEKIRSLLVKKPLKDEQEIISETIHQFDKFIYQNKQEISKLLNTKQGLLADLITGKVRI
jgi:type I restriction enzyme S subunit